jgi:hypothetical protein
MKSIKIISIYKTSIEYRGFKMALVTWFGFILFFGGGGAIAFDKFSKEQIGDGIIGLGMALFGAFILFFILRNRVYIPQKLFFVYTIRYISFNYHFRIIEYCRIYKIT